jgi:transcriptional regulator with XRE-family HTH domain
MPAKELTQRQKEDAVRLKAAFKAWQSDRKAKGLPFSQEVIVDSLGFGQSALSQYLNGHIPLNAEALLKICHLIGVYPGMISPSIVQSEIERSRVWSEEVTKVRHFHGEHIGKTGLQKTADQKATRKIRRG